jgi:hypothetical protein
MQPGVVPAGVCSSSAAACCQQFKQDTEQQGAAVVVVAVVLVVVVVVLLLLLALPGCGLPEGSSKDGLEGWGCCWHCASLLPLVFGNLLSNL